MNDDIIKADYQLEWNFNNEHPDEPFIAIVQHWKNRKKIFETLLIPTEDGYYIGKKPTELSYDFHILMWRRANTKGAKR